MNKNENEQTPHNERPTKKDPWDYQKFVASYNAHVEEYGRSYYFILGDEDELRRLEERYQCNPYANTISEFAEAVFYCEQGIDDIDIKYKYPGK